MRVAVAELQQLLDLGRRHLAAGRLPEAGEAFTAAIQLDRGSHAAVRGLGIALSRSKTSVTSAFAILEEAARLNGGGLDPEAMEAYALSLAYRGEPERAAAVFDALVALGGTADQHLWRVEQHWQTGDLAATQRAAHDLLCHPAFWDPAGDGPMVPAVLAPQVSVAAVIGEQANRLDLICKARALGWPMPRTLFLNAFGRVANRAFLDYWRPHFTMVEDVVIPPGAMKLFSTFAFRSRDGKACGRNLAYALLNREWASRGLPPVLSLTPEHRERGEATLREMGVPEGAWHVGLHARSASFNDGGQDNFNALRNAPIESYIPAIRRVVEAGGWVMRMGDPGMAPLPAMEGVVDYALSRWKCDWMDVFLCASSDFFMATQSGLQCVAQVFGVPLVVTNLLPNCIYTLGLDDLYIPRKLFSRRENRVLSFGEAFRPPYVEREIQGAFDLLETDALLHEPEEILAVVDEMIGLRRGGLQYTKADDDLQRRYVAAVDSHGYGQMGRVGRAFLADNRDLLPAGAP
jgi:putative glycosyltransferase (TIGR04372 family)